jgi:hypothetical protein
MLHSTGLAFATALSPASSAHETASVLRQQHKQLQIEPRLQYTMHMYYIDICCLAVDSLLFPVSVLSWRLCMHP